MEPMFHAFTGIPAFKVSSNTSFSHFNKFFQNTRFLYLWKNITISLPFIIYIANPIKGISVKKQNVKIFYPSFFIVNRLHHGNAIGGGVKNSLQQVFIFC